MRRQRYRVLERIDAGGMAEVFRAQANSIEGFSKVVAIKRVLPGLSKKRKFIRMFLDEAKLSLGLNHANIVQVFDVGRVDETYFIVMEFVAGTTARAVLRQCIRTGEKVPVAEAVYIASEVCKGLSYAHGLTDADGRALDVVHRDISPPNILLSNQGEVKITDFGLAKARSQLERTDPGFVKGKFGYLSPEAAYGEPIDPRTDIFAAGIVLWEMLAGRRLFNAETENKTLSLVRKAKVPDLTALNPEVSSELDGIVRKALARDRNARYRDAGEFGNALISYLFDKRRKVGAQNIARLVEAVLEDGSPRTGGTIADHVVEEMIQQEIERFVSLEPEDEAEDEPISFEDPSTWFDDAEGGADDRSMELQALRVGPEVTDVSTSFDVAPMQEAAKARERIARLSSHAERAGLEDDSLAIPIDVVQDLRAATKGLDPTQGPGVDGMEVEFDDDETPSLEDAWLDGDLDDVFEGLVEAEEEVAVLEDADDNGELDEPIVATPSLTDTDRRIDDPATETGSESVVPNDLPAHMQSATLDDDADFEPMPEPVTAVVAIGDVAPASVPATVQESLPNIRAVRDVAPRASRRPSDAMLLPVARQAHTLRPRTLLPPEDPVEEVAAARSERSWALWVAIVLVAAAAVVVWFLALS